MKRILCFGDSNTFGFNPENGLRYSKDVRWTGVLQTLLGNEYEIIEAGCNNRTCFRNNPEGKKFTGSQILPEYLKEKFDIVILALAVLFVRVLLAALIGQGNATEINRFRKK